LTIKRFEGVKYIGILSGLLFLFLNQSCVKEKINTSSSAKIEFSTDTLHFDTVFTQTGSATRFVKIFNRESDDITLTSVQMMMSNSSFRINVDGLEGPVVKDVRIPANDSIYVFVEVTVDPDQPTTVSPFVIEEYLQVDYNGAQSKLLIDAWGQNANYIPNRFNRTKVYRLDCDQMVTWNDPKPYVIYGLLYIDSCVLRILEGTQIHIHGGIGRLTDTSGNVNFFNDGNIVIGPQGSIQSLGSPQNPVVFQGDRLEDEFATTPGQWNGIRLLKNSKQNSLVGTIIKNSVFGVYVDSMSEFTMTQSIIQNTSSTGLFCFHPEKVEVTNSLIADNGAHSAALSFGGNYEFKYTTLANFGNDREALFMSNHFCYDFPDCTRWPVNDLNAEFINCVMTGSNRDEVWLSAREEAEANLSFDHCLIKVDELLDVENYPSFLQDYTISTLNWQRTDSLFENSSEGDFYPDSLSILEEMATPIRSIPTDLENVFRDRSKPDLGCYEYVY